MSATPASTSRATRHRDTLSKAQADRDSCVAAQEKRVADFGTEMATEFGDVSAATDFASQALDNADLTPAKRPKLRVIPGQQVPRKGVERVISTGEGAGKPRTPPPKCKQAKTKKKNF